MNKYYQGPEAELDLHQMTKEEARKEVLAFLRDAKEKKYKKIRIITGKGKHSKSGKGVLNAYVKEILDSKGSRYSAAKYDEGGEGALDVTMLH